MATSARFLRSPALRPGNDDLSSSPDPLATSINNENVYPRSSPVKSRSPSPRKRRTRVLEDITLSSPQKVRTGFTEEFKSPSRSRTEQFLSPWKIRVTVEAEPEDIYSGRRRGTSKTRIVPPHNDSPLSQEPPTRARSRSASRRPQVKRKTTDTPSREKQQNSGAHISRLTDLDTGFLDDDQPVKTKPKRKSATRKPKNTSHVVKERAAGDPTTIPDPEPETAPDESDTLLKDDEGEVPMRVQPAWKSREESPKLRELDFNRVSVRNRGGPPKAVQIPLGNKASENISNLVSALSAAESSPTVNDFQGQVSVASAVTYPTPDASVQDEEPLDATGDPTDEQAGFDTILESEGFTMIDLESLPSIQRLVTSPGNLNRQETHSPPNNDIAADLPQQNLVVYPVLPPQPSRTIVSSPVSLLRTGNQPGRPIPSYLAPPGEDESDLSSTVPSSPPNNIARDIPARPAPIARSPLRQAHTPLSLARSSPKLPSPPNQPQRAEIKGSGKDAKSNPPRLARVVRAGIALHGLLSPKTRTPSLEPSPMEKFGNMESCNASTRKERLDDLFVGFDSGTRRELRAGLRFGEELAKRQRLSSLAPSSTKLVQPVLSERGSQIADTGCRGETTLRHDAVRWGDSQAQKPESDEDGEVPSSEVPVTVGTPGPTFDANLSCGSIYYLDAEARERRWQLEREAISRQIENANTSQVIVIDSDSDSEDDTKAPAAQPSPAKSVVTDADEDIWLAEAEDAQTSSRPTSEDLFPEEEQIRQRERARDVISKPRRSLIPSPWKRGENIGSTSLIEDDLSGIFWQRPKLPGSSSSGHQLPAARKVTEMPDRGLDAQKMLGTFSTRQIETSTTIRDVPCQDLEHAIEEDKEHLRAKSEAERNNHDDGIVHEDDLDSALGSEAPYEETPNPPRTIRVPVHFNDTSELSLASASPPNDNSESESPPPSPARRPVTPRSALKGSRASLSLHLVEDSASFSPTPPRRVVFSRRSSCLDESGRETSVRMRDGESLSTRSLSGDGDDRVQGAEVKAPTLLEAGLDGKVPEGGDGCVVKTATPARSVSWFGRLTGWGAKEAVVAARPAPAPAPAPALVHASSEAKQQQHPQRPSSEPALLLKQSAPAPSPPPSTHPHLLHHPSKSNPRPLAPSTNIPSSSSPDPRLPPPPASLPVSGPFTDHHYQHLHILYLKSLTASFTCPGSLRPRLRVCVGRRVYSDDGEFAWEVTRRDAEVVERWFRGFEGRGVREVVREEDKKDGEGGNDERYRVVGWDEWDLCKRLYSIVAGVEVRRDERERVKVK